MANSKTNASPCFQRPGALKTIQEQLHLLEGTISRLLELAQLSPNGGLQNKFLFELSALDSIADEMKQALDFNNFQQA
jgi:hypothetical protein